MKSYKSIALMLILVLTAFSTSQVLADNSSIDFEGYSLGTVHGQDGWSSTGAAGSGCAIYDHQIADPALFGYSIFGTRSLRISNAVTSGCFGDQTFSKSLVDEAAETLAVNDGLSGGTRQPYFEAQWEFAATVPGAEQPGLSVVASPDRGDGARMSWVQMADTPTGLEVNFYDYQESADVAVCGDDFVFSNVVSGLDRTVPHTVKIQMYFVDGPANDIVTISVDGTLLHTGTSWEDYFRNCESNPTRPVDSILFRTGGAAAPATAGQGFLIDNLTLFSGSGPQCSFTTSGTTMTLNGDCQTDHTILVQDGFNLDGAGYTITAIDPDSGHFLGAVIKNGGSTANVTNLSVTTSDLANICDGGDDRLRGILFDGAGGSITNNTVVDINQGASGCQEGNGIEVRNAPFDSTGTDLAVTISGNTVTNYQKNGITANGSVAATITDNVVTGAGPVNYIAQNGIQIGFGGTAIIQDNTVSGNNYTPVDTVACGILYFEADGVKASKNTRFDNERDQCNFGKGGGTYNPSP